VAHVRNCQRVVGSLKRTLVIDVHNYLIIFEHAAAVEKDDVKIKIRSYESVETTNNSKSWFHTGSWVL
jgi:hypothetical protein